MKLIVGLWFTLDSYDTHVINKKQTNNLLKPILGDTPNMLQLLVNEKRKVLQFFLKEVGKNIIFTVPKKARQCFQTQEQHKAY